MVAALPVLPTVYNVDVKEISANSLAAMRANMVLLLTITHNAFLNPTQPHPNPHLTVK